MSTLLLRKQLTIAQGEQWKMDHVNAMECWDLEERISIFLFLYDRIEKMNSAGQITLSNASDVADFLETLYASSVSLLKQIKRNCGGFDVTGSTELDDKTRKLAQSLATSSNIGQAARIISDGGGKDLAELFNELQSLARTQCSKDS